MALASDALSKTYPEEDHLTGTLRGPFKDASYFGVDLTGGWFL